MGFAYVTHPDLGDQGALIADDPLVIAVHQAKGWVVQDLPDELDPDSSNGPGQVKDQPEVKEEINGPGLEALKAQIKAEDQPDEEINGPGLQDQPESDDQEINGPGGLVAQLIAQAEQDQADQEASRQKRSRKKDQTQPPSGEDQEGSE
jgi:hypothetical protein